MMIIEEHDYYIHQITKINLRPDNLPFDILYANIKARANDNTSSHHQFLAGDPLPTDSTSSSSSTARAPQSTLSSVASASQSTSSSLSLLRTIKSALIEVASAAERGTRVTTGAAEGSSFFYRGTTSTDVPTRGAFPTTGGAGNEGDDEDLPLDDSATAVLGERTSEERDTLRTLCLWMNLFFVIVAMAKQLRSGQLNRDQIAIPDSSIAFSR